MSDDAKDLLEDTAGAVMPGLLDAIASRALAAQDAGEVGEQWDLERRIHEARQKAVAEIRAALELPERARRLLEARMVRQTEAVAALLAPPTLMVLSGAPGCGKTVSAARWLWASAENRERGLWVTAARLARWAHYDNAEMDRVIKIPRLVLDDLGTEYLDEKGNYLARLDEVINERYAGARPTVITTNLNAGEFKARYHERIVDRVREDGVFHVVKSPSLRTA